jgi:hypothetical protein
MPSEERLELRVSMRKVLIGVILTVLPMSILGFVSLARSQSALEDTIGRQFKTVAESTAASISQFMSDRVTDVGVIAAEPSIVDTAVAANRTYQGLSDEAIVARIQKIDRTWNTPATESLSREILANRASQLLRRHHEIDPRILRVTVTDMKGAVIAASHKSIDYYQGDEEYWQNIYAQSRGAISVTDVLYDEATKSNYIGIGVPILEEGSSRFIGTVDALVDVSTIFPIVNRAHLGQSARTILAKEDGTVISAPGVGLSMNLKSAEYAAVQDSLGTLQGRQKGYIVAELPKVGETLIGFTETSLARDYKNLDWVVLVCEDTKEAFAPVRAVTRAITLIALLGLAIVAFLSVYYAIHRVRPMTEIGDLRKSQLAAGASASR